MYKRQPLPPPPPQPSPHPLDVNARPRARGDEYFALLDELLACARRRYGPSLLVHFENMSHANLGAAFGAYRASFPVYSDDVQGTAATVVAGVLAAGRATGKGLGDHTWLFVGDGPAATAVAELVAFAIAREAGG